MSYLLGWDMFFLFLTKTILFVEFFNNIFHSINMWFKKMRKSQSDPCNNTNRVKGYTLS